MKRAFDIIINYAICINSLNQSQIPNEKLGNISIPSADFIKYKVTTARANRLSTPRAISNVIIKTAKGDSFLNCCLKSRPNKKTKK